MICIDKVLSEKEIDNLVKEIMSIPVEKNNNNCLSSYGSINVDDLIETVKELKKVPTYNELLKENQELKKQLEEWEQYLINAKEMLNLQGHDGNYNYDNYMLGLYNGMEYVIALFEKRNPIYKDGKNIEFLNDKNRQKEFIEYLENEIQKQKDYGASFGLFIDRDISEHISEKIEICQDFLSKYKEIIGGKE